MQPSVLRKLFVERRAAGGATGRKSATRSRVLAHGRSGGVLSGSGSMTLPLSTLLPMFGLARPAGGDHAPKEDSAVQPERKNGITGKSLWSDKPTPQVCGRSLQSPRTGVSESPPPETAAA